jgi:predicted type IV restriction endonuclease
MSAQICRYAFACGTVWPVSVSSRLRRQIERDFPGGSDEVGRLLAAVESGKQDRERILAAVVFIARGDIARLRQAIALSKEDWRDVLVAGGLADADWPSVLDARLGPLAP